MAGVLFDGIDLKATYGFVVNQDSERDTAELDSRETQLYDGMNGAHIHDNGYKPRVIKLAGQVYSTSVSQLRENVNALKTFLSTARHEIKQVVFPDEPDRIYNCKIYGRFVEGRVLNGPVHNALVMTFGVNLIMPDPFVYGEEQTDYLMQEGIINNSGALEILPSLSLYPSALWSKFPIEDGKILYDWTDYVPNPNIQSRHVDFSGDGLFYIKMKGGHIAIGVDNSPYNSWVYSIGLGFQYIEPGVVTDGISISSTINTNSSGTIKTTYTTIPTLPTEYHEFVGWIDRMRERFYLFHLNSGNQLVALDISDSTEIEAESHLRTYVWGNADMPYARMCSPNLMSIGDSIGHYGMDSDPWSDYPKNFSLVLKDRGIKNWFVCNKHITSQKSAVITARLSTDIIPHSPQYCFLQSSNNDTSADPGIEDRITNINNGIAALKAADIKVILTNSIVTNPQHFQYPDSANFFKLANTYHTAETFPDADALIDINSPVADENGELKYPDYALDGIHPNRTGRGLIGDSIDRQLTYPNSDTMNAGRQAYYEKTLYSELTDEEYENEPVEENIGCVNWNPSDGVSDLKISTVESQKIEDYFSGENISDWEFEVSSPSYETYVIDFDIQGDSFFYIRLKTGLGDPLDGLTFGFAVASAGSPQASFGIGFDWAAHVFDGVSISIQKKVVSGEIKTKITELPKLKTQYCEFVAWLDRGTETFKLYDVETKELLATIDISDLETPEAHKATLYNFGECDVTYYKVGYPSSVERASISIPMTKPFWGDSYIDLDEMIFHDCGGFEEVTVSSGAATLSANGTGTCYLVDSSGSYYYGTVSGNAVTTDAPDGDYTVIYELETPLETSITPYYEVGGIKHYSTDIASFFELEPGNNNLIITPSSLIAKCTRNPKYL